MDIPKFNVESRPSYQGAKSNRPDVPRARARLNQQLHIPPDFFNHLLNFLLITYFMFSVCFSVYKHVEYLHHKLPVHNSFNIKIQVCTYTRFNTKHCSKNDVWPLTISSVNVTKSAGNCGFGQIYWVTFTKELFNGKLSFWKWK